jgi:hypothetical protein
MVRVFYFKFVELLKTCESILDKIRIEKEKLLQAELQERFGQIIELKKSLLTDYLRELESFFNSINLRERELISGIYTFVLNKNAKIMQFENQNVLLLSAEKEKKEWEAFAKDVSAPLPNPSTSIFYNRELYQQLILRKIPNLEIALGEWCLPILLRPVPVPIPSKFAFAIFNQYYHTLTQYWSELKVKIDFPQELEWKEFISNPDHGVYLHIADFKFDSQNLQITGYTEDHEPYVVENHVIKNMFNLHWIQEGKEVLVQFLIFDTTDKDLPFLNYLPYINVGAEPTVKSDLVERIMNTSI